jgi:hypothetical protein
VVVVLDVPKPVPRLGLEDDIPKDKRIGPTRMEVPGVVPSISPIRAPKPIDLPALVTRSASVVPMRGTLIQRPVENLSPTMGIPKSIPGSSSRVVSREWHARGGDVMSLPTSYARSFSGADITAVVHVLGNSNMSRPVIIANASTLSYSIHREKHPVRALGHTYPRGYTRGNRALAGSIIFTMFDREVLWALIQSYSHDTEWNEGDYEYSSYSPLLDQLPPFDLTVTFANEYGDVANMGIYGVEIVDEGTVMSIDDLLVEKTCSFVARDIDMIRPYGNPPSYRAFGMDISNAEVTPQMLDEFYQTLASRRRAINRAGEMGGTEDSVWRYDIPYDHALFRREITHTAISRPSLEHGTKVVYTRSQLRWYGYVSVLSQSKCKFYPNVEMYKITGDYDYRVHDSKSSQYKTWEDMNLAYIASQISPMFLMPIDGTEVRRDEVDPL